MVRRTIGGWLDGLEGVLGRTQTVLEWRKREGIEKKWKKENKTEKEKMKIAREKEKQNVIKEKTYAQRGKRKQNNEDFFWVIAKDWVRSPVLFCWF